jgi:hypothetical protein
MGRYHITTISHSERRTAEWPQAESDDYEKVREFGERKVEQDECDTYVICDDENDGRPVDPDSF